MKRLIGGNLSLASEGLNNIFRLQKEILKNPDEVHEIDIKNANDISLGVARCLSDLVCVARNHNIKMIVCYDKGNTIQEKIVDAFRVLNEEIEFSDI